MFKKSVCVLISGKAGVGKSTSANYIQVMLDVFASKIAPIAYGVKRTAYESFGWDGKKDDKGRQLLIDIGQAGRKYNPDIWVEYTFKKFVPLCADAPFDLILVDDWRFPNELQYLQSGQEYAIYTIRIEADNRELLKGTPQYDDSSETSLPCATLGERSPYYDFVVDNTKDYLHLYAQLDQAIAQITKEQVY
jgi:hypothetical protein